MSSPISLSKTQAAPPRLSQRDVNSLLISFYIVVGLAFLCIVISERFLHWFMIPLTLCGIAIGVDAVNWLRGRYSVFDPIGIIGLMGIYFFFITPLLIVAWNYQLLYLPPLDDFRPWLGYMGILNFLGLLVYRMSRKLFLPRIINKSKVVWRIDPKLFFSVLLYALVLTGVLQLVVYAQFGGIGGYISTYDEHATSGTEVFRGLGAIFTIAESFPILLMLGFVVHTRLTAIPRSWLYLSIILIIFLVIRTFFGGLRGSRSNTVWVLFWAIGVIHLWIRPVPKKLIFVGIILMVIFMYLLGFFKALGSNFGRVLENINSLSELEKETNRSFRGVMIGDLGRADVQAYLLYRLARPESDYEYAWGRTYLGGLANPIPSLIWPNKPVNKVKEGTEALRGKGKYDIPGLRVRNIYGLAGEAMLNFTPLAAPVAFVVLGFVVARVRSWLMSWDISDSRVLLAPFLVVICFLLLIYDLDNIMVYLAQYGFVSFLVIWISSRKQITSDNTAIR
jgi:hypothetical protein